MFTLAKNISRFFKATLLLTVFGANSSAFTCTDFIIKTQDNVIINGRSMEFGEILPTKAQVFPRGQSIQSMAPNQQKGMKWTSKYAYLGMMAFDQVLVDGFNEKGLAIGALWFPDVKYPDVSKLPAETIIALTDLTPWILGNFSTVDEVKEAVSKINVYASVVPGFNAVPPAHFSIHDAQGKSIVIEFLDNKMQVFDNPVDVLTNAPSFPWHLTNLRNYINLTAMNAGKVSLDGTVLQPTGQGSGMLGIPGDWTPPSRFVRMAAFKQFVTPPKDAAAGVNTAIHLLNTVDIPYGVIRGTKASDFDFTQWIVVKDLTNKVLYVRTYGDQNVQTINLLNEKIATGSDGRQVDLKIGNF